MPTYPKAPFPESRFSSDAAGPKIERVYPLSETRAARERMEQSAHCGKLMLAMQGVS